MADAHAVAAPAAANQTGADHTPAPGGVPGDLQSSGWQALFQGDELKSSKSLARYKTLDDFGKAYTELETAYRTKAYEAIPGEDAPPEARAAFFKKLPGYPESADKYAKRGLDIPAEAGSFDEAAVSAFLQGAHGKGFTNEQVGYVLGFYEQFIGSQVQAHRDAAQSQISEAYGALKARWGAQTDLNLLIGDEYLRRTYGEEASWFETLLQRHDGKAVPLRNVPEFIDMAFQLGRLHGHDKFVVGNGAGGAKTPEQSQQAITEARARYSRRDIGEAELTAIIEREGPNAYREGMQRIAPAAAGAP